MEDVKINTDEGQNTHEHKPEHKKMEHHTAHKQISIKKSTMWQTATAVLAVLFVIALFTKGFSSFGGSAAKIDTCVKNIEQLSTSSQSAEFKDFLATSKENLLNAKALIADKEQTSESVTTGSTDEKVKLDFYVMSQCPYGTQVEDAIKPVLDKLGKNVDFNLNFIANDNGDGTFRSLHGQNEVDGNIQQLCAIKYYPDKYMDFVVCQNKNAQGIPGNYESCATEVGIDKAKIKSCWEGTEGKELLKASIVETNKVGATGSPTIYLNGNQYSGARAANDFLRALCNEFTTKPQACADIPAAVKIKMIAFSDKRCKDCATIVSRLNGQLKSLFPGLEVQNMDYATDKKFYEDNGLTTLPALLFEKKVEETDGYANIQRYLVARGEYLELRIGSAFDPSKEICDNKIDDTNNGKVDCDDPDCSGDMLCREEIQKKLDVYVMSQCPYGVKGLDAMKEVLTNFKGNINFNIHFIASDNGDGTFTSLHGQGEVDENIRELCAIDLYPNDYKYMDYIWCRNKDIKSTAWESCATDNGMDAAKIKACADGEKGKELLRASIKETDAVGISASPTWLANNKVQFSGIDSQTVKTNFCSANQGLTGCDKTLTGNTGSVPAGSC